MARVTVEDCLEKIPNRFELVMVATRRARDLIKTNTESTLDWENDKPTVVALREIAAGLVAGDYISKLEVPEHTITLASMAAATPIIAKPVPTESDASEDLADLPPSPEGDTGSNTTL